MPSDARTHVTIRLGTKGVDWLVEVAAKVGVDKSVVHRAALAVAKRHEEEVLLLAEEMK